MKKSDIFLLLIFVVCLGIAIFSSIRGAIQKSFEKSKNYERIDQKALRAKQKEHLEKTRQDYRDFIDEQRQQLHDHRQSL